MVGINKNNNDSNPDVLPLARSDIQKAALVVWLPPGTHLHCAASVEGSTPHWGTDVLACNVVKGKYRYTKHLLPLEVFLPIVTADQSHGHLRQPRRPEHLQAWSAVMESPPDRRFASLIIEGLNAGFRIVFSSARVQLRSARNNLSSAIDHADQISAYLSHECSG